MEAENKPVRLKRVVSNEDVQKYEPLVEKYIRDSVVKNWNEANRHRGDEATSLGNTGNTLDDFRQYLRLQVVIALQNYNPDYRTPEGQPVKEFTFVYGHLGKRIGQKMKQMTSKHYGYGVWTSRIESVLRELDEDF